MVRDLMMHALTATRGGFQGRQGGGGDQGALLSRLMRLDVLKFLRFDPDSWIFAITEYFLLLNTPTDQRLRIVGFNLEGTAKEWFRWMKMNGLITYWDRFVESVKSCFRPSKYEDPQGALSKLLQLGTVEDYQRGFEKLMNRVTDIPESLLISFYISGLKLHLQRELLVSRPTTLGDAFAFARITETRITSTTKPSSLPNPTRTSKPLAIKWISPVEWQERLNKGLCFNCDNQWTRGHKYPGKFLLLMTEEEDDIGATTGDGGDDAVESGDISILNSLIGHGSPLYSSGYYLFAKSDDSLGMKKISLHQMQAMLEHDDVYGVYEIHYLSIETEVTTLAAHLEYLECVFNCLQERRFYVKKTKCVFGAETLEYLGHMISGGRVEMDPRKVIVMRDWPELMTQRQMRGWGDQEVTDFWELKQQLSTTPILSLLEFTQEFVVEADASDYVIWAVLLQNNHPISYFSQKLGPRMCVASTYQKELFAIVEVVYKWRQYLIGRRFKIRTDHKSIKELMQQVIQILIQQKYVRKLMGFDFVVEYKPGVANQVVDALSRMYEDRELVKAEFMAISQPIVGLLGNLKSDNETLEELEALHQQLDTGSGPDGFRREEGLLIFRQPLLWVANQVADALSQMYEDRELVKAEFMAISQPIVGLLGNLKSENEKLEELRALHQQLDTGSGPDGFL
ncbi:ty3-gypsy retrotransposon protein [Tanacetum coccineum]